MTKSESKILSRVVILGMSFLLQEIQNGNLKIKFEKGYCSINYSNKIKISSPFEYIALPQ